MHVHGSRDQLKRGRLIKSYYLHAGVWRHAWRSAFVGCCLFVIVLAAGVLAPLPSAAPDLAVDDFERTLPTGSKEIITIETQSWPTLLGWRREVSIGLHIGLPSAPPLESTKLATWGRLANPAVPRSGYGVWQEAACGWPWPALWCARFPPSGRMEHGLSLGQFTISGDTHWRAIPYAVRWAHLAADLFTLSAIALSVHLLIRALIRRRRRRFDLCERCGYELGGITRCSECGRER